jgi:nicotinamide phosphoribosyltransferase
MTNNLCLLTDSYKASHHVQYPPGTTKVYSYLSSRGGKFHELVFHGLQYILMHYFAGESRIKPSDIIDAKSLYKSHFGRPDLFNADGFRHIAQDHSGRLPLSIKAVPEGTVIATHNVLMTIENTCPQCYWLTNYLETLLMQVWFPITVATQSREIKRVIAKYLQKNGDINGLPFKLHDFGFRGVSSVESAAIGGTAHLVNFMGTDTVAAIGHARRYYAAEMPGYSVPASEHSTITSWEHEVDAFRNMLEKYPDGLMACVSDSYNIFKACTELWGGALKDAVLARNGILVIRPDSGNPVQVILEVLKRLGEAFGVSYNAQGYKLLHPKVRIIQGDGVNLDSITEILRQMDQRDWSADNIAFGMGGALLQKLDRDTQKMAIKCSYVEGIGEREPHMSITPTWRRDVFKDPVTDPGKHSMKGRLKLVKKVDGFHTEMEGISDSRDELIEVFRDGDLKAFDRFDEIRERAAL